MTKIKNRKCYVRKQKADTSRDNELDLLGDKDADSFTGSQADLEGAAEQLFELSLNMIFWPLPYLRVNILNPLPPLQSGTRWDRLQELNTDFSKICISPKPSGAPIGKAPLPVLKELEHQARQNLSTINFMAAFAKTSSSCNSTLEKCQHSLKSSFKKVKSQIQKGANPEKAARRGYEEACEYLEIWNKTILIQQRALVCQSKSLAYIFQRELYTMGNTGLLRREAEMTLLQPQLGDTRCQELRNSPFCKGG